MAIQSTVTVIMTGRLGGRTVSTIHRWFDDTEHPLTNGFSVVDAFYQDIWLDFWQPLVSNSYILETLVGWYSDFTIGTQPSFMFAPNETGLDVSSDSLPGYATVNIFKVPDNTTLTPSTNSPMSTGFFGISGITENRQNNGLLESLSLTDFQDLAGAMIELSVFDGVGASTYRYGIYRDSIVIADRTYAQVLFMTASPRLGIRSSRKR